jgi:hypothetical protein
MNDDRELISALAGRERARSRMRMATAGLGAAALATAGVVAYQLPAPAHKTATTTVTPSAQPTQTIPASYGGDDGSSGVTAGGGTAHSTSGGS